MERTEAIEIIRRCCPRVGDSKCEFETAMRELIPELRESEDERVRKWIYNLVSDLDPQDEDAEKEIDEMKPLTLAWLEKQKEPIPIPDKFSGLKSLMLQYLQSAANRKDDTEIESDTDLWGRKILDYVWKYDEKQKEQPQEELVYRLNGLMQEYIKEGKDGSEKEHRFKRYHLFWDALEDADFFEQKKQKEQKPWKVGANAYFTPEQRPAEWSDTNELVFKDICKHLKEEGYNGWIALLNALRNGEFQPKQEWSEEDKKMIDTIVSVLGQYIDYKAVSGTGSEYATPRYSKEIDWLKSLLPQNKIHYWTEEEIEPIIDDYLTGKEHYGGMITRLRCLKPKSHWKPSEEQKPKQEVPADTEVLTAKLVNLLKSYRIGEETATDLANRIADTYGTQRYLDGLCDGKKDKWKPSEEQEEPEYYQHFDPDC